MTFGLKDDLLTELDAALASLSRSPTDADMKAGWTDCGRQAWYERIYEIKQLVISDSPIPFPFTLVAVGLSEDGIRDGQLSDQLIKVGQQLRSSCKSSQSGRHAWISSAFMLFKLLLPSKVSARFTEKRS